MRFCKFIIILLFLWWPFDVRAQISQKVVSAPEQWQLTLDVIKSKAQVLMVENSALQFEYRQLTGQVQNLQQSIDEQQNKNDQMDRFLKQRHGRTDQQLRIEELTQTVKTKNQEVRTLNEQWGHLKAKQSDLDKQIQRLKNTVSTMALRQQAANRKAQGPQHPTQPKDDDQLAQWRRQLEDESRQEAILENELKGLKSGNQT
jgi:predicted nuclease with TOPRIM domain